MSQKKSRKKSKVELIQDAIEDYFNPGPAVQAAAELYNLGVRESDIMDHWRAGDLRLINSSNLWSTVNAMRDIERNQGTGWQKLVIARG